MALVIKSNVKKATELSVADEFCRKLEMEVEEMLRKAEERAKANGRRTIFERDL